MGKKMLGREAVSEARFPKAVELEEGNHMASDEIITAYLAHMATLGWKMMPREMTSAQVLAAGYAADQVPLGEVRAINQVAYDHAPEPTFAEATAGKPTEDE